MQIRSANLIVALLSALAASWYLNAQESLIVEGTGSQPPCSSSRTESRDTKWNRHELGFISICLPDTLERRRTGRCGARCFIFESEDMYFDADLSVSAWRPTFEKSYASFTGVSKPIDGKQSTVWFFEDTGKYKYVSGVNIILERGQIGMGVYLFSKTFDPKPIADRMFNSIKFVKAVYN